MSERTPNITWPYAVIVLIVVGLALVGTEILSAGRAYIGGQRHWSKAERDAVTHLVRYGGSHLESDYQRFSEALAVPLGDRRAREALDATLPTGERLTRAFSPAATTRTTSPD